MLLCASLRKVVFVGLFGLFATLGLVDTKTAHSYDLDQITFSITSSAKTSTPNLRIGVARGKLPSDGWAGGKIQTMPIPEIYNYYLTKNKIINILTEFGNDVFALMIQTDQDTKMYTLGDVIDYLKIYADTPATFSVR